MDLKKWLLFNGFKHSKCVIPAARHRAAFKWQPICNCPHVLANLKAIADTQRPNKQRQILLIETNANCCNKQRRTKEYMVAAAAECRQHKGVKASEDKGPEVY